MENKDNDKKIKLEENVPEIKEEKKRLSKIIVSSRHKLIVFTVIVFILIFAYVSRFNAVAFGAINSGIGRIPPNMMEASLTLGKPFGFSFIKIILPLIKPSILTATILAFVDIIKELPITLLLRPFNFETLATYVYQYANDEMLGRASGPALLIVFIGLIPILFINNVMNKKTI